MVSFPLHKVARSQFTVELEVIISEESGFSSHGQNSVVMQNTYSTRHILVSVPVALGLLA